MTSNSTSDRQSSAAPDDALESARRRGRRDAELFDLRLRRQESQERERRLAQLAWKPRWQEDDQRDVDDETAQQMVLLEARVSELQSYQQAVETSTPWRFIQWLRGLFGRAW